MAVKSILLSSLPVFTAAARQLSFKKAAEDLHVTASAVSQQIKALESHLDQTLFERTSTGVALTEAGQKYYELASVTLRHFEYGLKSFRADTTASPLRLTTTPFIASEVLIPALYQYNTRELRIETSEHIVDFSDEECSVGVRIGRGSWADCVCQKIMPVQIAITGSPALLRDISFTDWSDLKKFPLIHSSAKADHWKEMSGFLGIDLRENKKIVFDNYIAAVSATERGMGLLVTLLPITNNKINEGKLVSIHSGIEPDGLGYYFVEQKGFSQDIRNASLYNWVKEQFIRLSSS